MPAAGSKRMHLPPRISLHFGSSNHAQHKGYSNEAESRYACHGEPVRLAGYRIVANGHVRLPLRSRGFDAACLQQASRSSSLGLRAGNQASVSQRARDLLACFLTDPVVSGSSAEISWESSVNEPDATDRGISIGSSSPLTRSARPSSLPIAAPTAMIGAARISTKSSRQGLVRERTRTLIPSSPIAGSSGQFRGGQ